MNKLKDPCILAKLQKAYFIFSSFLDVELIKGNGFKYYQQYPSVTNYSSI